MKINPFAPSFSFLYIPGLMNLQNSQITYGNATIKPAKIEVQRFKGLGEMNASQLRETTMLPGARRLVQLTVKKGDKSNQVVDMLLSKKRSQDRKEWLEDKGNLANV